MNALSVNCKFLGLSTAENVTLHPALIECDMHEDISSEPYVRIIRLTLKLIKVAIEIKYGDCARDEVKDRITQ